MKLLNIRLIKVVGASLCRGAPAALLPGTRRHSAVATGLAIIAALLALPLETSSAKSAAGSDQSSDPGWPREKYSNGTRLLIYQPQVDDWKNFQELTWRMAVSLTPKGGKEVVGVVEMKGNTDVDDINKVVLITNPKV